MNLGLVCSFQKCGPKIAHYFEGYRNLCDDEYVTDSCNSIGILLRRTLVQQQVYSSFGPPRLKIFFNRSTSPASGGQKIITLFEANRNVFF